MSNGRSPRHRRDRRPSPGNALRTSRRAQHADRVAPVGRSRAVVVDRRLAAAASSPKRRDRVVGDGERGPSRRARSRTTPPRGTDDRRADGTEREPHRRRRAVDGEAGAGRGDHHRVAHADLGSSPATRRATGTVIAVISSPGLERRPLDPDHELGDRHRATASRRPVELDDRRRARRARADRRRPASTWRGCRRACRRSRICGDPTVRAASASAGSSGASGSLHQLVVRDTRADRDRAGRPGSIVHDRSSATRSTATTTCVAPVAMAASLISTISVGAPGEHHRVADGRRGRAIASRRREWGRRPASECDCTKRQASRRASQSDAT